MEDPRFLKENSRSDSIKKWAIIGVGGLCFVMIGGSLYFWQATAGIQGFDETEGYQAVFLTNGQVYFGKVANQKNTWVELTDIYYLQSRDSLQNQDRGDFSNQSDLTLVKLGQELHGPTDYMQILRSNILFIENLAEDSKVVQAIKDYQIQR